MDRLGIITKEDTTFVLVDFQDKLAAVISNEQELVKNINILTMASEIFNLPLIVTEQYPQGLGKTSSQIALPSRHTIIEKVSFSCFDSVDFVRYLSSLAVKNLVLFGVEAHICVLKTALSGLKANYQIHVVADAISSRKQENVALAIKRMQQSGVFIVSTEMILFQLLEKSTDSEFKTISKLVR